ncbi:MAG: hypothetical protein H6740_13470 [Alphaproteobacteria bacterium]|nr:hypothetical protein [Alphaproteobacteria bacterium]
MIALLAALTLAATPDALAQDCNARQLEKDLAAASPMGMPGAFQALADCDAAKAKAKASVAFGKALVGDEGTAIAVTAVQVGAWAETRTWISGLQADERSRTVAEMGGACADGNEQVAKFLSESAKVMGDQFWTERWYRSLSACRFPEVQEMLRAEVQEPSEDRTRFFGVLEVFCRNLGKDAVDYLKALSLSIKDEEELTYVISAFADAAQVGSASGQDAEATQAAVAAILEVAPQLPERALEQARTTLTSLGAEDAASSLATYRFESLKWEDGALHYGLLVVENATCKKGETRLGVHVGSLVNGGDLWPDQVAASVGGAIETAFTYDVAKKCKGTAQKEVRITEGPVSAGDLAEWQKDQLEEAQGREAKKIMTFEEPPLEM